MKKKLPGVYTIGYEQSRPEEFAARLTQVGVDVIIDVRAVPLSRKPGFSKNKLIAALAAMDVEYKHFVGLGAPKDVRDALRAGGSWAEYERSYHAHLEKCEAEVQALLDLSAERMICLLCFERNPNVCHRSLIAARLAERQTGLLVTHILY